jgi:anaerobic nitric oxide reductase transcription regulator
MRTTTWGKLDVLFSMAVDLTAALGADDRYRRLLDAVCRVVPADAAALLRLDGSVLVPVAVTGLNPDVLGRRFLRTEHPRLDKICSSSRPIRFPVDSSLPDPFDGLLSVDPTALRHVHACLGCPLVVENQLIGALTADALAPNAFDGLDDRMLAAMGAIAGAAMRTSDLIEALERSASRQGLIARDLMDDVRSRQGGKLIGDSAAMRRLRAEIELTAPSDFNVLIQGETGVGKELVAHAVHAGSHRKDEPLVYVNCAALPESLADSELFGHVKGAFTGAGTDRHGKFEVADRGTIFLDEIGELPLSVQPKLLRALQQGEIQRVGSDKTLHVDVRVIAATNRDLVREVESGRFRADLFHRLNVYPLRVPSLRDRPDDIPMLAGHFCERMRRRLGLGPVRVTADTLDAFKRYSWPGNVRELENVMSRLVLRAASSVAPGAPVVVASQLLGGEFVAAGAVESAARPQPAPSIEILPLRQAVDRYQRDLILHAVSAHHGNWAAAARALGMHRSNLHHLAARLGLHNDKS